MSAAPHRTRARLVRPQTAQTEGRQRDHHDEQSKQQDPGVASTRLDRHPEHITNREDGKEDREYRVVCE